MSTPSVIITRKLAEEAAGAAAERASWLQPERRGLPSLSLSIYVDTGMFISLLSLFPYSVCPISFSSCPNFGFPLKLHLHDH
jgi:hypothetical protein